MCSGLSGRGRIAIGMHIRSYLYDSDGKMVCPHRTAQSISSLCILEIEQVVSYLNFKFAAPPTAFAWASIVGHCGQLDCSGCINYHNDDFKQSRLQN